MYPSSIGRGLLFSFVMATMVLLSSCSSLGGSTSTNSKKGANDAQGGTTKEGDVAAIGAEVYKGPDPMVDIQINSEIKKVYSKVASLDKSRKYTEAINLLEKIQLKYPQLSGPDYQKARIYFSQKKLDVALTSVEASLKNNARNYYSLNLKGVILREKGDFEGAKIVYLKAIEVYPPYPNSHLNLGVLSDIYMRNLPLALIQYKEYMKLTSNKDKTVANWILEIERRIKAGG